MLNWSTVTGMINGGVYFSEDADLNCLETIMYISQLACIKTHSA